MFDEEGRKIDLGQRIGMPLKEMSVIELNAYIDALKSEITRVEQEITAKKSSAIQMATTCYCAIYRPRKYGKISLPGFTTTKSFKLKAN